MNDYVRVKSNQGMYEGVLNNNTPIENYIKQKEKIIENMTNDKGEKDKLLKKAIEDITEGVEKAICQAIKD